MNHDNNDNNNNSNTAASGPRGPPPTRCFRYLNVEVNERDNRLQMAFGFGGHMCLGQHLAILEVERFFQTLLPRLSHIEMVSEPEWVQANFVGGLKSMPVRYAFNPE